MNLKPGKTELLLFGTSQRIARTNKNFEMKFNNQYTNETKSYKYLGVEVDHTLNLNSYFDKTYKKMTPILKSDSRPPKKIVFFASMKAL